MICARRRCTRRTFMDSGLCMDHQPGPGGSWFLVWSAFVGLVALVLLVGACWAAIELVLWVRSQ